MSKTCFVISPIGAKDSDIRERADSLYDLIIEPALEKFDFNVTRADKNLSISSITSEIVQLVQESDLCVIDITGHNPNVMYECGRRHETAKPYIMMAEEGEKLPFDINTIRTIFYNLDDARGIRNTVKVIQAVIEKMLESGFEPGRSGESLSTLSDTLTRIERKIDRISVSGGASASTPSSQNNSTYQEILSSLGLTGAFNYALTQRDIGLAEYLLPNLEKQLPVEKYVDNVLTQAAPMGSIVAHQKLVDLFDTIDTYDDNLKKDIVASLAIGFGIQDREKEGLELMSEFFDEIRAIETPSSRLSIKDKAFYLNQYQRLYYGAGQFEEAKEIGGEVLSLQPENGSYIYNYSLICEKVGELEEAYKMICRLYSLMKDNDDYDDDHLSLAVKLFASNNDTNLHEAFSKLQDINPYRATMLLREKSIKNAING